MIFETSTFPYARGVLRKPSGEHESFRTATLSLTSTNVSTSTSKYPFAHDVLDSTSASTTAMGPFFGKSISEDSAVLQMPVSPTTPMTTIGMSPSSSPMVDVRTDSPSTTLEYAMISIVLLLSFALLTAVSEVLRNQSRVLQSILWLEI
jgi:hypothetical protein